MTSDMVASLLYLGLLIALLSAGFLVMRREKLSTLIQQATIWVLIFVACTVTVGLWQDLRGNFHLQNSLRTDTGALVTRTERSRDGHYYLTLELNGEEINFVVDTGATDLVLTRKDAARIGFDPAQQIFTGRATTANGEVRTAYITVDEVRLGEVFDENVPAVINGGEMQTSLLGMRYLDRFGSISIQNGALILTR